MPIVKIGQSEFIPNGIFPTHFSHNIGKNHETYIEYVDNREITLPLSANHNELKPTRGVNPRFGLFGNWNGKGIYERGFCKEEQKRMRKEKVKLSPIEQNILRNREYYYGNTQKRR